MSKLKKRVLKTINKAEGKDAASKYFDLFIMTLIILNVIVIMTETVEEYGTKYELFFRNFEIFSVTIFSIEYIIRLWTCTAIPKYAHPVWGRIRYVFSAGALVDLIAILPFYLPMVFTMNTMLIRMLRLFRLLRIFKLGRYFTAFQLVMGAISKRKDELVIVLGLIGVMLILSSSMMYYIENDAQPEVFTSIPATMWWGVATLTTVGYGDVYPITPLGKLLGAFIAVLGIGVFALPAGIIATSFESELGKQRKNKEPEDE
ncbi:MAG: ion transporter [Reichenbachiella sp.]